MKQRNGFTVIEIILALVIVAILSIIVIPVYRGYVKRGISTEGKALLSEINIGQQSFHYRTGKYYDGAVTNAQVTPELGVNAKTNKYFTSYSKVTVTDTYFKYKTNEYQGKALTITGYVNKKPEIVDPFSKHNS